MGTKHSSQWHTMRRDIGLKLQRHGLFGAVKLGTLKLARYLLKRNPMVDANGYEFDRKHGTDTATRVELGALDMSEERLRHAVAYSTAIVDVFLGMLRSLRIPYHQFVFVDIGSGKGRALMLASSFPFKTVVGVELSRKLHEIALNNVRVYRSPDQQCSDIRPICQDAAAFDIPRDKVVLYLFNPFDENVLTPVVSNIEKAFKECGQKMYILYLKTVHRSVFDKATFLKVYQEENGYVIYETIDMKRP